jgi:hypothetical protein
MEAIVGFNQKNGMIGAIFKVTLRKGQIVDTFLELIC